jgi:hypothetical protein
MAKRRDMLERLSQLREAGKSEIADGTLAKVRQFTVSLRGSRMVADSGGGEEIVQTLEVVVRTGLLDPLVFTVDISAGPPHTLESDLAALGEAIATALAQVPVLHRQALEAQAQRMRPYQNKQPHAKEPTL